MQNSSSRRPSTNQEGSVYIVTGMCCDREGEESKYPQLGDIKSSSATFQAAYWRCIVVYFASSVRHNPNATHLLFTNADEIPDLDGFKTQEFFDKIGVKVVHLPFTYKPPLEYYDEFRGTFFKFDFIKFLGENSNPNDRCIALDSDCIWIDSAARMLADIEKQGLVTFDLYEPVDKKLSRLTRLEMQKMYAEMGFPIGEPPKYYGAEFIVGTGKHMKMLTEEVDRIWEISLQRFHEGKSKFNTEEQMLSYIYNKEGYALGTGNNYFNRIWTSPKLYTASEADLQLDIWHLPAEKNYGIRRLFGEVANPKSAFWTLPLGKQFVQYIASYVGIPKRNLSKTILDTLDNRISGIQKRVKTIKRVLAK